MPAFLSEILPNLPRLAALKISHSLSTPSGAGTPMWDMLVSNGNAANPKLVASPGGASQVAANKPKSFSFKVGDAGLLAYAAADWPPPDCGDIILTVLGAYTAIEEYPNGRLQYGAGNQPAPMEAAVAYNSFGMLTITTTTSIRSYNLRQMSAVAPASVFVCLYAKQKDAGASITDLENGRVADFVGLPP